MSANQNDNCKHVGCNLPQDIGWPDYCILHYDSADKDVALFNRRLEEKIQHDESNPSVEEIDLSGVVFPAEADLGNKVFGKDVSFRDVHFMKNANFAEAQFQGVAYFWDAQFHGEANFAEAQFHSVSHFWHAEFHGVADFSGAKFDSAAHFDFAQFHGRAHFDVAKFHGEANFWNAEFGGRAIFVFAKFHGRANFWGAEFREQAYYRDAEFHGAADFGRAEFRSVADFSSIAVSRVMEFRDVTFPEKDSTATVLLAGLRMGSAGTVRLEGMDLDLSRVSFLRTDLSCFSFVGCKWPQKRERRLSIPFWIRKRAVIYDELALYDPEKKWDEVKQDLPLVAEVYRQLRLNYEANRQEIEAGAFYVGQMDMRRRDTQFSFIPYRVLLGIYRVVSMYGESYVRPLCFYFAGAFLFAFLYLLGGFEVNGDVVRYGWRPDLANTISFILDYGRSLFLYALTAGALLRSEIRTSSSWVPLVQYVNILSNILFITLFVVALRRKFHR